MSEADDFDGWVACDDLKFAFAGEASLVRLQVLFNMTIK
jgi:hypothetical protein